MMFCIANRRPRAGLNAPEILIPREQHHELRRARFRGLTPASIRAEIRRHREIQRLRAAGLRVPNSLWWAKDEPFVSRGLAQIVGVVVTALSLAAFYYGYHARFAAPSFAAHLVVDLMFLAAVMVGWLAAVRIVAMFDPPWFRLAHIRFMRRRLSSLRAREPPPGAPPRRVALLAGLGLYALLLAGSVGAGGLPLWFGSVAAALGPVRALAIILPPLVTQAVVRRRCRLNLTV